ncbi:hypothetical protein FQR65_LT08367 [Abscondita terminalis]|nr:hypothetical protein FQR65_LT08367 [Abscondita terminalis]
MDSRLEMDLTMRSRDGAPPDACKMRVAKSIFSIRSLVDLGDTIDKTEGNTEDGHIINDEVGSKLGKEKDNCAINDSNFNDNKIREAKRKRYSSRSFVGESLYKSSEVINLNRDHYICYILLT